MLRRQKPGEHHTYPEHRSIFRRMLWRLGFDPLTVYERLRQVRHERDDYARMMDEAQQVERQKALRFETLTPITSDPDDSATSGTTTPG